eukprot:3809629-Karenia_brevis.AAC.1
MPSDIKEQPDIEILFSNGMRCNPDYDYEEDGSDSSTSCPPLMQSEDDEQHDPIMQACKYHPISMLSRSKTVLHGVVQDSLQST